MARPKLKYPKLSDREAEIMSMLWQRGPLFVREMLDDYPEPKPHFNTVSTTVRILEDKGYVGHEQIGGSYRYHAVAEASDFAGRSLAQVIKSYFNGSASAAVSALVEDEKLSVAELREIIRMLEQGKEHN